MRVAFDLDGTISAYPALCESMAAAFTAAGHHVLVLTGHAVPDPAACDRAAVDAFKREACVSRGFKSFHEMVCCVVRNSDEAAAYKAGYCKGHAVDILVDDAANYCRAVKAANPGMLVLHVHEK
jgi:phosphoglycolate phosphatase-like HAD superfamily hydrolase